MVQKRIPVLLLTLMILCTFMFTSCSKQNDDFSDQNDITNNNINSLDSLDNNDSGGEDASGTKDGSGVESASGAKDGSGEENASGTNNGSGASENIDANPDGKKNSSDIADEQFITFSITGSDASSIFPATQVAASEGDTVYDILKKITRENEIQMEVSGAMQNIYVEGINNLYEFDEGPTSGWMYLVNGEAVQTSCSNYKVTAGDIVEWKYTLTLGDDMQ